LPLPLTTKGDRRAHSVAFSPDGRLVACGDNFGFVRIWDVFAQREVAAWKGHQGQVYTVAFSPDNRTLASGGTDTTILLWNTQGLRVPLPSATGTVKELYTDLAEEDAPKAYRAVWSLTGYADKAITHLRTTLRPVPKIDAVKVQHLIKQLNDDDGTRRDEASAELEKFGNAAAPALRRALDAKPSAEIRRRVRRLLEQMEAVTITATERTQRRALLVVELIGSTAAKALLEELAAGEPDAPLTRAAKQASDRVKLSTRRSR
jgi:hypothetical protein